MEGNWNSMFIFILRPTLAASIFSTQRTQIGTQHALAQVKSGPPTNSAVTSQLFTARRIWSLFKLVMT